MAIFSIKLNYFFLSLIGTQENHLTLANKHNQLSSRIQALASLGRLHFNLGQVDASVSYLEQALAATEGTDEREDEAIIRYRLVGRQKKELSSFFSN